MGATLETFSIIRKALLDSVITCSCGHVAFNHAIDGICDASPSCGCTGFKAAVDGKEPTESVKLPPAGQAGSSPASGTTDAGFYGPPVKHRTPHELVEDARFEERVHCAVLVLGKISYLESRPASDAAWLTDIAKAILARGKA